MTYSGDTPEPNPKLGAPDPVPVWIRRNWYALLCGIFTAPFGPNPGWGPVPDVLIGGVTGFALGFAIGVGITEVGRAMLAAAVDLLPKKWRPPEP
jgi:hypothetical protein